MADLRSTVLLVTSEGIGKSDAALQLKLAGKFFQIINEHNLLPNAICFYTEGVRLVTENSPVLDILGALEQKGVRLIVCSTCLETFGLMDKVKVGIVGGMPDIIEAMVQADKTITL